MFMSATAGTILVMQEVCLSFVIMLNTLTGQLSAAAELDIMITTKNRYWNALETAGSVQESPDYSISMTSQEVL